MKTSIFYTASLLFLLLSIGCSEDSADDEISTLPETRKTLLVGKIWRLTANTVNPARARNVGSPAVTDWYADMQPCERDAQKIYFFNGDLVFDEGPTRSAESDVQTFTGSWTFNADETIITELQQNFINIIFSFKILELTETQLMIERQQVFLAEPGVTYTFVETYEAL